MGLEQINPAVLAATIQGVVERGHTKLDSLEVNFLLSFAGRLRREGANVWTQMKGNERRYLQDVVTNAHRLGLVDQASIIAQELGFSAARENARTRQIMERFEQQRRALNDLMVQVADKASNHHENDSETTEDLREASLSPNEFIVLQLKRYFIGLLKGNAFEAQKAWRKYDRVARQQNDRMLAYLKMLAVNEALREIPGHLSDPQQLISDPARSEDDRLRAFIGYAKSLRKLIDQQSRMVEEALSRLPDPDVTLSARRRALP
mgnify:CR=1 FL=1